MGLINNILSVLGLIAIAFGTIMFMMFLIYGFIPFVFSFSPEKRLERFVNEKCIEGNEIAIKIRQRRTYLIREGNGELIRSAIEGNEGAIRALELNDKEKYPF
jgi:hypothetical protein